MRCVIARVLPVPAPASTHTGPRRASATSRWSGSSASRIASAERRAGAGAEDGTGDVDITAILAALAHTGHARAPGCGDGRAPGPGTCPAPGAPRTASSGREPLLDLG